MNREREHTEFALLSSAVLSEELKCVVSTERDTGCDSSQEPNLDTVLFSGGLCCPAGSEVPGCLSQGIGVSTKVVRSVSGKW